MIKTVRDFFTVHLGRFVALLANKFVDKEDLEDRIVKDLSDITVGDTFIEDNIASTKMAKQLDEKIGDLSKNSTLGSTAADQIGKLNSDLGDENSGMLHRLSVVENKTNSPKKLLDTRQNGTFTIDNIKDYRLLIIMTSNNDWTSLANPIIILTDFITIYNTTYGAGFIASYVEYYPNVVIIKFLSATSVDIGGLISDKLNHVVIYGVY